MHFCVLSRPTQSSGVLVWKSNCFDPVVHTSRINVFKSLYDRFSKVVARICKYLTILNYGIETYLPTTVYMQILYPQNIYIKIHDATHYEIDNGILIFPRMYFRFSCIDIHYDSAYLLFFSLCISIDRRYRSMFHFFVSFSDQNSCYVSILEWSVPAFANYCSVPLKPRGLELVQADSYSVRIKWRYVHINYFLSFTLMINYIPSNLLSLKLKDLMCIASYNMKVTHDFWPVFSTTTFAISADFAHFSKFLILSDKTSQVRIR